MSFTNVPANAEFTAPVSRLQPTAAQISRLASMHMELTSNKHAKTVLRNNGFSSSDANVQALRARIVAIFEHRQNSVQLIALSRTGRTVSLSRSPSGRPPVLIPKGSPQWRLEKLRKATVTAIAKSCIRHGAAGGTSFRVQLTDDPAEVGYTIEIDSNWTTYAGAYKGWRAIEDHHQITAPHDWRTCVVKRGLATVDGCLTLNARQIATPGNAELFQATWAQQGRGYSVTVRSGFIARIGKQTFRAETAQAALKGIQRKARVALT